MWSRIRLSSIYIYIYIWRPPPLWPTFWPCVGVPSNANQFCFFWEGSSPLGGCLTRVAFGGFANKKGDFIQKYFSSKRNSLLNQSCCVNPFCSSPPVRSLLNRSLLNQSRCVTPSGSSVDFSLHRPLLSRTLFGAFEITLGVCSGDPKSRDGV